MLTTYILEFLAFGFVGWLLDSIYRLITDGQFLFGGYFRWVPIRPIYGIGGIILIICFKFLKDINPISLILIASSAIILLEYISGIFSKYVLGIKLWDYSHSRFNIGGKVDILHSLFWIALVLLFYAYAFDLILYFEGNFSFPDYLDLPVFWSFVAIILFATIKNHPAVTFGINKPMTNLCVYDYHKFAILLSNFKKAKDSAKKALFKKQLQPYLSKAGLSLKEV